MFTNYLSTKNSLVELKLNLSRNELDDDNLLSLAEII